MSKTLFLRPRLSEQTYTLAQTGRVYVFDVPKDANKHTVARAVTAQFEVVVENINMTNVKGKPKRTYSVTGKRRGLNDGTRSAIKKAYVKLAEGHSLPIFAAIEETEKKEEAAQEQADKAISKQLQKEAKQAAPKNSGLASRIFRKQGDK